MIAIIQGCIVFAIILLLSSIYKQYKQLDNKLDNYLNKTSNILDLESFNQYIKTLNKNKKQYHFVLIDMNYLDDYYISQIVEYLKTYQDGICYEYRNHTFVIIYEQNTITEILSKLQENIISLSKNKTYPTYIISEDIHHFDNVEELFYITDNYKNDYFYQYTSNAFVYITKDYLLKIKEMTKNKLLIKKIIDEGNIQIFIQPIYDVKQKKFICAEVLARLYNNQNLLLPSEFINIAEKTGFIIELERIVLEKSCSMIKDYQLNRYGIQYLELNLSIKNGEQEQLVTEYKKILNKYEINPTMINLEVTESLPITKKDVLLQNMNSLTDIGVHFSLDDFGSGESNLNYLIDMPISIVKFDKNMIDSYFNNDKTKIMMTHLIKMVHDMNLKIVAEGIETESQFQVMCELGIDFIQGYYFSKPLCIEDYIDFLLKYNTNVINNEIIKTE